MRQYPTSPNCPGSNNRARTTVVMKLRSFPETNARYVQSDPWMASRERFTAGSVDGISVVWDGGNTGVEFKVASRPVEVLVNLRTNGWIETMSSPRWQEEKASFQHLCHHSRMALNGRASPAPPTIRDSYQSRWLRTERFKSNLSTARRRAFCPSSSRKSTS